MFVQDVMTPNPITVTVDATLPDIANLMHEKNIRRVPVMDHHGKLVGIITDRDVRENMPSPATSLSKWEINTLLDQLKASEIMTSPVLVTGPDCPLEEAARMLIEKKIGALPVVKDDELVGIITETDFFRAFVDMLSGGDVPGLRFVLRVERHKGILAQLASIINENGGAIIAIATENEPDGKHKKVLVKEEGADAAAVRKALTEADIEVLDVRERRTCAFFTIP
ncbi:MAG TPA: CBS domain-containing protein [Anaerolineae bacterium]|nr:CBS domain-containing protein [Anaerolineae bacterium]